METKRIFVLGNGFDLAHYLPTAYVHFMDAMMVVESNEENKELGFDDLFQKYVSVECSERDKDFFQKTKELYNTDDLKLSAETVKSLQEKLKNNGWFQHFKHHLTDVDTWIDFENEIEEVLLNLAILFNEDFEHSTIINDDIKFTTEYPLDNYKMDKNCFKKFLGNTSVQFSPKYLNSMKFRSTKIQKILYEFSILSDLFGLSEKALDLDDISIEVLNHNLYGSHDERTKAKVVEANVNHVFMEFNIGKIIDQNYLERFTDVYVGFNKSGIFEKILNDLHSFSELFTSYIGLIINQLEPAKFFDTFGDLEKEIEAVHTFNYSNTFERLYPKGIEDQLNQVEVQYIHGSAECKNIVLGISDLDEENLRRYKIYGFVKTFQKLINNTDYRFLDDTDVRAMRYSSGVLERVSEKYEIIIWGHSLDASDSEYIKEMFNLNDALSLHQITIIIWYHGSPHTQLANLMHIMGKDVIQEWMKKGWLVFEAAPDIYEENHRKK